MYGVANFTNMRKEINEIINPDQYRILIMFFKTENIIYCAFQIKEQMVSCLVEKIVHYMFNISYRKSEIEKRKQKIVKHI